MNRKLKRVIAILLSIVLILSSIPYTIKAAGNGDTSSADSVSSSSSGNDVNKEGTRTAAMGYAITVNNKKLNTGELDNTYSVLPGFKKSLSTKEKTKLIFTYDSKAIGEEVKKAQARGSNVLYSTYLGATGTASLGKTVWCIANVPGSNANVRSASYSKTIAAGPSKTWEKGSFITNYDKCVQSWNMKSSRGSLPKPCGGEAFSIFMYKKMKDGMSAAQAFQEANKAIGGGSDKIKWAQNMMAYFMNGTVKTGSNISGFGNTLILDADNVTQRLINRGDKKVDNIGPEKAALLKQTWNIELLYAVALLAGEDAQASLNKYIDYCDNADKVDLYTSSIPVIEVQPLFLIPTLWGKTALVCTAAQAVNRMNNVSVNATGNQPVYFKDKSFLNKKMQSVMEEALKATDPGTNYAMHGVSAYGFPYLQAVSLLQLKGSSRKPPSSARGFIVTTIIPGRYYYSSMESKKTLFSANEGAYGLPKELYQWYNVATIKYQVAGSGENVTYTPLADSTNVMTNSLQQTGVVCQYLCLGTKQTIEDSLDATYGLYLKGDTNREIDKSSTNAEEDTITIIKPKDGEGNTGATKTDNPVLYIQLDKLNETSKEDIQTALQVIKKAGYKNSEIYIHTPTKLQMAVKTTGTIKYDGEYKYNLIPAFNHSANTDTKTLNDTFSLSNLLHPGWHDKSSYHKRDQLIRWDDVKAILENKHVKIAFRDSAVSKSTNFSWKAKKGSRAGSIRFTYSLDTTYKGEVGSVKGESTKKTNGWYLIGVKEGKASERQYINISINPTKAEVVYTVGEQEKEHPKMEKTLAEPQVFAEMKDSPMFTSDKEHLQEALGSVTTDRKVYYNAGADEFLFDFKAEIVSNQKAERNYAINFSEYISQCAFDDIDEGSHIGKEDAWTGSATSSWYTSSSSAKEEAKKKVYDSMWKWYQAHVGKGDGNRQWCGHTDCETLAPIAPPPQRYEYSITSTEVANGTKPETYHTEYQATVTLEIDIVDHAGCGQNCNNRVNPERFGTYTKWVQKYTGIPYVAITYASVAKLEAVDGSTKETKILQTENGEEINDWTVTPGREVRTISMLLADKEKKQKTAKSGRLWYSVMTSGYDKVNWQLDKGEYNGVFIDSSQKQGKKNYANGKAEEFNIGDFKQDGSLCGYKEADYIRLEKKEANPIFEQLKTKIYDIPITMGVQSDFLIVQTSIGEAAIFNYWDDTQKNTLRTAKLNERNIDQNEQSLKWTKGEIEVSNIWNDTTSIITDKNRLQGDALTCAAWKQEDMSHIWYRGSPIEETKKFEYQTKKNFIARDYTTGEGQYVATLYDTHHKDGNTALNIPECIAGVKTEELEEYKVKENRLELEKEYKGEDYQYSDHKKYEFFNQSEIKNRKANGLYKDFDFYGAEIYKMSKVLSKTADDTGFLRSQQEVYDTKAEEKAKKMLPLNGVHELVSRARYKTILSYQYEKEASKKGEGEKAGKDYDRIADSKYIRDDQRIEEDIQKNYQCNPLLIHDPVSCAEVSIQHSKDYPVNQIVGWSRDTVSRGDAVQTVTKKKMKKQSQEFITNGDFSTLVSGTTYIQHFKISNSVAESKAGYLKQTDKGALLSTGLGTTVTDSNLIQNEVTIEQVANGASSGAKYLYQVNVVDIYHVNASMELSYNGLKKSQELTTGENKLTIDSMPDNIDKVYVRIKITTTPEQLASCTPGTSPGILLKSISFQRETPDTYLEKFVYTTLYGTANDILNPGQPAEKVDLTSSHIYVSPTGGNFYIHATGAAGSEGLGGAGASVGGNVLLQKNEALIFKFDNNGGKGFSSLNHGGNSVEVYKVMAGQVPTLMDIVAVAAGGGGNGPLHGGDAGYPIGFDGESYMGGDIIESTPTPTPTISATELTTGSAVEGGLESENTEKTPGAQGGKGGLAGLGSSLEEMSGEDTAFSNGGAGGAGAKGGKAGEASLILVKGAGGGGGSSYVDLNKVTNVEAEERGTNTDPKCYAYYIIPEILPIYADTAYFDSSLLSIPNASDDWYETTSKEYTATTPVKDVDGNKVDVTMNLYIDMDFTLVYPNVGDYYQTATQSPARILQSDLWSKTNGIKNKEYPPIYTNNMETTKWLKSKYVVFGFDVIYNGIYYYKGDKIHLPIVDEEGKALQKYNMHIPLSAKENMSSDNPFDTDGISGALQAYAISLNARNQMAAKNETNVCFSTIKVDKDLIGEEVENKEESMEGEKEPEEPEYEETEEEETDTSNKVEIPTPELDSEFEENEKTESNLLPPPNYTEEKRDSSLVNKDWGYRGLSDKRAYNRAEKLQSILSEKEKELCEIYTKSLPAILFTESEKTANSKAMESYNFEGVAIYNYLKDEEFVADHTATKISSVPVIGRIGNFMIEDTGDWRFANLFKEKANGWLVEGLVPNVSITKPNNILGDDIDIFGRALFGEKDGVPTSAGEDTKSEWLGSSRLQESWNYDSEGGYIDKVKSNWNSLLPTGNLDTYGSIQTAKKDIINSPVLPVKNNITGLRQDYMKIGYNLYADIQTIGQYKKLEISPKYYIAKNTSSGVITKPVDLYYKETGSDSYKLLNKFDTNIEEGITSWSDYSLFVNLSKEYKRRNISEQEKYITINYKLGDDYNTFPDYNKWIGTPQYLFLDYQTRTYVGRDERYGDLNNKEYREDIQENTYTDDQRWHFTMQLPTTTIIVDKNTTPGRKDINEKQTDVNKYKGNGWYLICTAQVVATQELELWQLEWKGDQPQDIYLPKAPDEDNPPKNDTPPTKVEIPREDIPWNIITVYETKETAKDDLDIYGTH